MRKDRENLRIFLLTIVGLVIAPLISCSSHETSQVDRLRPASQRTFDDNIERIVASISKYTKGTRSYDENVPKIKDQLNAEITKTVSEKWVCEAGEFLTSVPTETSGQLVDANFSCSTDKRPGQCMNKFPITLFFNRISDREIELHTYPGDIVEFSGTPTRVIFDDSQCGPYFETWINATSMKIVRKNE